MKNKIGKLVGAILIFALIICLVLIFYYNKILKNLEEENLNFKNRLKGMSVTMIGGSTMLDKGNTQSCGYVIRTQNGKLIMIDGGVEADAPILLDYINRFGNGTVDYWIITHGHIDHVGALTTLLENENIIIENICYSLNPLEWYKEYDKRGYPSEEKLINLLENSEKIKNKIECQKGQIISIDNIDCEIIRIANPEIIHSDNGNDSSMVFKLVAKDVNKSMIFLGDAYVYASKELMEEPEKLKADAVQMSHHGQNGVSEDVYKAIAPELCFFNTPEWLYNNDNGEGYDSGKWQSIIVRGWLEELGTKNILAFEGDRTVNFTEYGLQY